MVALRLSRHTSIEGVSMRLLGLAGAAILAVIMAAGAAQAAAPGFATSDVNMRTGPDTDFPSVGIIPEGATLEVFGCLNDESWCDVGWQDNRGWVFGEYLSIEYRGVVTPLPDVGLGGFGIPVVVFNAGEYWGHYYVGRPWFRERDRWIAFKIRPRDGWRAPPHGPRKAGWWRSGYRAPHGHRPPAEHWERRRDHDRR
jgi:uncharacterized protein YraI